MSVIESKCVNCGHPVLVNFPERTPAPPRFRASDEAACPIDIWDGPYKVKCGRLLVDGECGRHGRTADPEQVADYRAAILRARTP